MTVEELAREVELLREENRQIPLLAGRVYRLEQQLREYVLTDALLNTARRQS